MESSVRKIGGLTLLLMLIGTALVPASGAAKPTDGSPQIPSVETGGDTLPKPPLVISQEIKNETPHWILLTGSKSATLAYIKKSNRTAAEKRELRRCIRELWSDYPVKRENENGTLVVSFATERTIDEEDKEKLGRVGEVVSE